MRLPQLVSHAEGGRLRLEVIVNGTDDRDAVASVCGWPVMPPASRNLRAWRMELSDGIS
jgi:hypothetical protein